MAPACKVACIQVNAQNDMAANIAAVQDAVRSAAADGAQLIATPENVTMMAAGRREIRERAMPEDSHAGLAAFRELAAQTGAWLLVGSLGIALPGGRVANRSYLIEPTGDIAARYDKIHMFDVELPGGETYRESANFEAGREAVLADTPWGLFGLTICYDVRFPQLYRSLAHGGARLMMVPSAFTRTTGEAHWHVLLRARAIETGAFVIAPAQTGTHPRGRQTYGHSLIVDPWGRVLADGGEQPGIVMAELDLSEVDHVRSAVPSLDHDRDFAVPPRARADIKGAA